MKLPKAISQREFIELENLSILEKIILLLNKNKGNDELIKDAKL